MRMKLPRRAALLGVKVVGCLNHTTSEGADPTYSQNVLTTSSPTLRPNEFDLSPLHKQAMDIIDMGSNLGATNLPASTESRYGCLYIHNT